MMNQSDCDTNNFIFDVPIMYQMMETNACGTCPPSPLDKVGKFDIWITFLLLCP